MKARRFLALLILLSGLLASCQLPSFGQQPAAVTPTATSPLDFGDDETPAADFTPVVPTPIVTEDAPPADGPPAGPTPVIPQPTQEATPPPPAATQPPPPASGGGAALPSANLPLPASYTLRQGEFPFCIARRYNVNPSELLSRNGLRLNQVFYPGQVLRMPQTGRAFPGARALRTHTASYTVRSNDETFYTIACYFGDLDPAAIAAANALSLDSKLRAGQVISLVAPGN